MLSPMLFNLYSEIIFKNFVMLFGQKIIILNAKIEKCSDVSVTYQTSSYSG